MYSKCMKSKSFNISLPVELIKIIDRQASREYTSRSEYIRRAVFAWLEHTGALNEHLFDEERDMPLLQDLQRARLKDYMDKHYKYKSSYDVDLD